MTNTLMPPSSSPLEKAADLTAAHHIEAIPIERIFDQWHPQRCPAELLGWLAWAVSVDDWNSDWPEQVKRDVIESSVEVHRHKGTLYSVKQALSSLAIETQIAEWTENTQTNVPHSFIVSAFANQNFASGSESVLDENFYQLVRQQVTNTKPARSRFAIHVGAAFSNKLGVHTVMGAAQSQRYDSTLKQDTIESENHLQVAACSQLSEITRHTIYPMPNTLLTPARMQLAAISRSVTLAQIIMETV